MSWDLRLLPANGESENLLLHGTSPKYWHLCLSTVTVNETGTRWGQMKELNFQG